MTELLQFVVLGLGVGAIYALTAQGLVLIYRGSGIVNFAHGDIAMFGAFFCFLTLVEDHGWSVGAAIPVAAMLTSAFGSGRAGSGTSPGSVSIRARCRASKRTRSGFATC